VEQKKKNIFQKFPLPPRKPENLTVIKERVELKKKNIFHQIPQRNPEKEILVKENVH